MKKRLIAMLIAMVMLVGTVTAYAEVQETTTFEGEDDDLSVQTSFGAELLCKEAGENDKKDRRQYIFVNADGKEFPDLTFYFCKYLGGDAWCLQRQGDETVESCMVKEDGTVLFPWALADINRQNENFVEIVTGEEQTDNVEESVMNISPKDLTAAVSGTGDTTPIYYKGKRQLYDLKGQKLLEDRVLTKRNQYFYVVGTTYMAPDEQGKQQILDASGKVIEKDASDLSASDNHECYVVDSIGDGVIRVYDDHLKLLATTDKNVSVLEGGYLSFREDDGKFGVMSLDGSILLEPVYDAEVEPIEGGAFKVSVKDNDGDILHGVVDKTGKTLVEPKYSSTDLGVLEEGYFYVKEEGGSERYSLYAPDGNLLSDQIMYQPNNELVAGISENDLIILNTGETLKLAEGSDGKILDTALVAVKSPETRRYGAFELRDGKQLLDYEWENITAAYGRLYAYKDGVCHVFAY